MRGAYLEAMARGGFETDGEVTKGFVTTREVDVAEVTGV